MGAKPTPGRVAGSWHLTADDVALIADGARVLGSGGGGDPYLGQLLAIDAVRHRQGVTVVPLESLDDDDMVMVVAQVGTATVFAERLARGRDVDLAVMAMERYVGKQTTALMCYEIGGVNSLLPLVAAAQRGLPVVDADLMGRAFPELQMTTLDIYGAPSVPVALCDDRGNVTIVAATEDMYWTERLARALTLSMGGLAYIARPVPRAADLKRIVVPGSYTRARSIGSVLQQARTDGTSEEEALILLGARVVLRGIITGIERRTTGQVSNGLVVLQDPDGRANGVSSIEFQNEYLLVKHGADTVVTTPDIICVLDEETGAVVDTEALHAGVRVVVIALPVGRTLTTPLALRVVGPVAFGYDIPYQTLASHGS